MQEKLNSLIDSIIADLVNQDSNIENALLKTQVLAFKLKNEKLKQWVNCELNGYASENETPSYRIVPTQIKGDLFQGTGFGGYQQLPNSVLPIEFLNDKEINFLRVQKFNERISQLQELSKSKNGLIGELPYSFLLRMTEKMRPWEVIKAWKVIPSSSIVGILSTIKSNLINFLLELNEELGNENIPLMERKLRIDKILEKNIGEINASNVNISIGDSNFQSVNSGDNNKIQLAKGNITNGYDLGKLREFIDSLKNGLVETNLTEDETDEVNLEIMRVEKQIAKSKPSFSIINSSLKVIYDILAGVAGNAFTEKILLWINQIGNPIG